MRPAIITAFLTLAAPAHAQAQDAMTAETLLQTFTDRCTAIAADPEAVIAAGLAGDGSASGAVTTDKAILQYQELTVLPGADFANLFFGRNILPGGSTSFCVLTVNLTEAATPIAYPELTDLVGAAAEGLLGRPVTRYGSDVFQQGEIARMHLWATGDTPGGPSISILQSSGLVQLSIQMPTVPN
jgi:hypothetical protein